MSTKKKAAANADLRAMSVEDLRKALAEQQQELLNLRFKHATAQLEKTSELKATKQQIARIQTIMQEKV